MYIYTLYVYVCMYIYTLFTIYGTYLVLSIYKTVKTLFYHLPNSQACMSQDIRKYNFVKGIRNNKRYSKKRAQILSDLIISYISWNEKQKL